MQQVFIHLFCNMFNILDFLPESYIIHFKKMNAHYYPRVLFSLAPVVVSRCPLLVYCVTSYSNVCMYFVLYICVLSHHKQSTCRVSVMCIVITHSTCRIKLRLLHWISGLIQRISISFQPFIPSSVHRPWVFPSASLFLVFSSFWECV